MTSKKITEMPIVQDLDGGDWLTGVDNSAVAADKNVRITKNDLLKGVVGSPIGGSADTRILVDNESDVYIGSIGHFDDGVYMSTGNGTAADGGVWAGPEVLELYGAATTIWHLKHEDPAGYQTVSVSPDGYLFGESPPAPGWTVTETDASNYDTFGQGTGVGPWVEIAGCAANPVEQILVGDAFNLYSQVYISNTSGYNVVVEIGYGVNGAEPAYNGSTYLVVQGQVGYLPPDLTVVASSAAQYETSDVITLWVRRASGSHVNATFEVIGSTFQAPCTFTLSTPGESGSAAGQFFPVRRVEDMTAGGSVDIAVDGGAVTVNVDSGNAVTLTSSGSGQDDSAREYTASIDFIHGGTGGSVSVSIDAGIEQMNESGAITVAVGVPVSAILRTRADGTVQLYRSTKA